MWRRGRDSNPRDGSPPTPLAGARLRPLGHLSKAAVTGFAPGGQGRAGRARVEYGRNRHMVVAAAAERGESSDARFDALDLARFQFAFTVAFHIIFPAFSIGLASYLAVLNGAAPAHRATRSTSTLFNYWKTIFAVAFGMGVVSGIVMSYQFGTNWSVFSDKAGPGDRAADGLRGADAPSSSRRAFSASCCSAASKVGPRPALPRHADGRGRHARLGLLDPRVNSWMQTPPATPSTTVGQFVPEDWWAVDLQPVLPLPARAHGARGLSHHRARRRRGRRLAPAARRDRRRRRARCSRWRWA